MQRPLILTLIINLALCGGSLLADAKISQKTQVQLGGVLGAAANVFGGRSMREGVTSEVVVKGNRRVMRNGETAEVVDLDEEKIYTVDHAKKTYKVTTFAELRKQFEDAMKEAQSESKPSENAKKDPDAREYEVVFDSKNTGAREEINGYNARQVIATVTVKEKGKKLEQSGGLVLTADLWMAPRIAAVREHEEFERRYIKKLWADTGMDLRSMAALAALAPDMSKAMKKFQENLASMEGSAVRTVLTFETVPDPRQKPSEDEEGEEEAASAANQAVKALGGFMNRMRKKPAEEPAEETKAPAATTKGGTVVFTSKTELLSASASASSGDVAIPEGYKLRK
jgi:hypothetical protein